jgi:hypothetical protein
MRTRTRYALAGAGGVGAGVLAYVLARPVVEPTTVRFVTGLNVLVWATALAVYLAAYDRLDGFPVDTDSNPNAAFVWGGIAGLLGSLGFCGGIILLVGSSPFRYAFAVGLFAFGLVVGGIAIGMGATATRLTDASGDGSNAETAVSADD